MTKSPHKRDCYVILFSYYGKDFNHFYVCNFVVMFMLNNIFNIIFEWIVFSFKKKLCDVGYLFEIEELICDMYTHYYCIYVWK